MKGNKWETWNKQDGEAQIEKWESGIDLKLATDTEIREYTDTKLYEYVDCFQQIGVSLDFVELLCDDFKDFTTKDFDRLGQPYLTELRRLLRSFGVNVLQGDNLSIAQSLVDVPRAYEQGTYIPEGYDRPVGPNAPKVFLPFASSRQEPIPLRLQHKELPEERQERLRQECQKRQQQRPQNRPKAQPAPKSRCLPQPSTCRHCKENFGSRNALFRHLGLQNVSIPSILRLS